FAYALIICKILGATAIMLPQLPVKLREWAYAGLTFNLIFAVISHVVVDKNISYILLPVVIGAILAVSYFNNQKINNNGKLGL
ncbi:MAG: DoxX family protein, partial [Mucilaginibacter sp.]